MTSSRRRRLGEERLAPPSTDFDAFFRAATTHEPYGYQRALGKSPDPPATLSVPTGAGKTQALIVSWLYGRLVHSRGPRRLVYALPMRTLVEQTEEVARGIREKLKLNAEELPICTLMGGTDRAELRNWQMWPERSQILIGTIDMLLSRALNRGYATSRFMWPVPFGLLHNDCRWIFDEVQLMGSARATSAQLHGLRASLGTMLPCETVWVSATIDEDALTTIDHPTLGHSLALPGEDRSGALKQRLEARKTLQRVDLAGHAAGDLAAAIARTAIAHHVEGTRTLVVLNTVDLAQAAYRELRRLRSSGNVLLHSRFRPLERQKHMRRALDDPDADGGMIVVATQVVEAGVDMSARTLITETAPFSSIVQRLGRCNREGEHQQATILWLDKGPLQDGAAGSKAAAPYEPEDVERARAALLERVGQSLSPAALEQVAVDETPDDPAVLRRRDLLDLFDTTPDLSGMDIDVAPFIRDDDQRSVAVLFRDVPHTGEIEDRFAPERDELVQVPLGSLGRRARWTFDHVDGRWIRRAANDVSPGATVMLRAADGGYDPETGWDVKAKAAVEVIPLREKAQPEGIASDFGVESAAQQDLLSHLSDVANEAERLSAVLTLAQWREVLRDAAALHDIGKAHPVFQNGVRTAIGRGPGADDGTVWAKSGTQGRIKYDRDYFRHELASALAIRRLDGAVPAHSRDLIAYLAAAHHGKVRMSIRPAPDERRPADAASGAGFALGVVDGDVLPALQTPIGDLPAVTLSLSPMELGADDSWTNLAVRLRDDPELGPFRIGFLEALLRIADWRASGA